MDQLILKRASSSRRLANGMRTISTYWRMALWSAASSRPTRRRRESLDVDASLRASLGSKPNTVMPRRARRQCRHSPRVGGGNDQEAWTVALRRRRAAAKGSAPRLTQRRRRPESTHGRDHATSRSFGSGDAHAVPPAFARHPRSSRRALFQSAAFAVAVPAVLSKRCSRSPA
jgi:hypothetical protein